MKGSLADSKSHSFGYVLCSSAGAHEQSSPLATMALSSTYPNESLQHIYIFEVIDQLSLH